MPPSRTKINELAIRALDARAKLLPETPGTLFLRATAYDSLRLYKPRRRTISCSWRPLPANSLIKEFQARHRLKAIEPN